MAGHVFVATHKQSASCRAPFGIYIIVCRAPGSKSTDLETAYIAANFAESKEVVDLKRRHATDGLFRQENTEIK